MRTPSTRSLLFASERATPAILLAAVAAVSLTTGAQAADATTAVTSADLVPAAIDARLAAAGTMADFDAALAEIVAALGRASRTEADLSREARFDLIGRFTAYERFQELTEGRARCDVMVPLIGFGYAPRENNVDPRTLPDGAQEVIALVPLYCTLLAGKR